jgi:DNA-binding CsgD family transcriptional regulator
LLASKAPMYMRRKVIGIIGCVVWIPQSEVLDALGNQLHTHYPAAPSYLFTEASISISQSTATECGQALTQRQSDCLFYLAQGKSAKEIAEILNISKRTVEHHINAVKSKYNCFSRSDLVAKAMSIPAIKNRLLLV